jgi:digeranylgeranylglycerophospholipid reductase
MPTGLSTDSFIAIGDTVPTIDPLWGEGIHKGMKSARAAAITVDSCLTPHDQDTSAEQMALYDHLWHTEVAPKMRTRLLMTELLYLAPNERYDTLMRDLNSADEGTLNDANNGDLRALLKLLRLDDASLVKRLVKERYLN